MGEFSEIKFKTKSSRYKDQFDTLAKCQRNYNRIFEDLNGPIIAKDLKLEDKYRNFEKYHYRRWTDVLIIRLLNKIHKKSDNRVYKILTVCTFIFLNGHKFMNICGCNVCFPVFLFILRFVPFYHIA